VFFLYVTLVLPVRGGHSSNNYASIWTVFSTSVTGPDVLCHLEFFEIRYFGHVSCVGT